MNVTLKLDLVKDAGLTMPRFTTPGPVSAPPRRARATR